MGKDVLYYYSSRSSHQPFFLMLTHGGDCETSEWIWNMIRGDTRVR